MCHIFSCFSSALWPEMSRLKMKSYLLYVRILEPFVLISFWGFTTSANFPLVSLTHTHVCFCEKWGHPIGVMVFTLYKLYVLLPYTYPKPKLSPHRKLCISTFPPKYSLCMIYKRFEKWGHDMKRGAFSASASWVEPGLYSLRQHEREGALSGRSATEDLVFKLK